MSFLRSRCHEENISNDDFTYNPSISEQELKMKQKLKLECIYNTTRNVVVAFEQILSDSISESLISFYLLEGLDGFSIEQKFILTFETKTENEGRYVLDVIWYTKDVKRVTNSHSWTFTVNSDQLHPKFWSRFYVALHIYSGYLHTPVKFTFFPGPEAVHLTGVDCIFQSPRTETFFQHLVPYKHV
ncbi:hypothetical protein RF11_01002 [Thelohanellus kitauei]|uniref:Uncharacterized protein n=1 Tax=Thelohanellus kitauei TaxID=669202 RepID=A0A0C2M6T7_THEKT|nr:hypothetical protein RF11_01002 [Thelohanellus kitauei]